MSAITQDILNYPQIVGAVGAVMYAQVSTWLVQYDAFILTIAVLGLIAYGVGQVVTGEQTPMWSTAKAFVAVFIVMLTLYRPVVYKDVREYAPAVSEKMARDIAAQFGNNGATPPAALPWPVWATEKLMNVGRDIAIASVREENRFVIPMAENAARMGAAEAAFQDANTNGAQAAWSRVIGPAILRQYPDLANTLKQRGLEHRFLHPSSPDLALSTGKQADQVMALINDANIDFAAVMNTQIGPASEYLRNSSPWAFQDGVLSASVVTQRTLSTPIAPQPDGGSMQAALGSYQKGRALLESFGPASRPTPEEHRDFSSLYRAIGNAVELATAKNLGATTNSVVAIGSACQDQARCREHVAQGRDVTIAEAKAELGDGGVFENLKKLGSGLILLPKTVTSAAEVGVMSRLIPMLIGTGKSVLLFAMPIALAMALWAGTFSLFVTVTFRLVVFFGLWEIGYILYWGYGEKALSLAFNFMDTPGYMAFPIINAAILGLIGAVSFMAAFMQLDRLRGMGGSIGGAVAQSAGNVSPGRVAGAALSGARTAARTASAVSLAPQGFKGLAGLRAAAGIPQPPGVSAAMQSARQAQAKATMPTNQSPQGPSSTPKNPGSPRP